MALDEPNDNETPLKINELDILMEDNVRSYAAAQVLDYVVTPRGEGFSIAPAGGSCC